MPCSLSKYVIVLACGKGTRIQTDIPKQYLCLGGLPIVMHTIQNIHSFSNDYKIILVINKEHTSLWEKLTKKHAFSIPIYIVYGGKERFFSVKNALEIINEKSLIAIHDGVRPFVNKKIFENAFNTAEKLSNAVCAVPSTDSTRILNNGKTSAINRNNVFLVQTPQVFQSDIIKKAYEQDYNPVFTDDASVVESLGYNINIIQGSKENIKITYPTDLVYANAILKNKQLL